MKRFLIALSLVVAPAAAAAQHAEAVPGEALPEHGVAGEGHATAGHGEGAHAEHADPSKTFNWFENLAPFGSSSYKSHDKQGGTLEEGEEPMSVPFILVLVNFGIVLFIIGWKVGPMAGQMAAKRSDEIKSALDEAARLRNDAKDKLGEYDRKLRAAETEIDQMIKEMRADAESEKQRIIAAAEAQAAALKKDAEERIAAEIDRARHTLQREVAAAASAVAERVLAEKITAADQAKLVDTFLRDVTTGSPGTGASS
jgi:F-type H+-transporting ATPase subunit b